MSEGDATTESFVKLMRDGGLRGEPANAIEVAGVRRDLPAAYKAFLLLAGRGCELFEGSHYAIEDDLGELQRAGTKIAQHGNFELPTDAFVFLVHQGFACQFFLLQDGDDPAVYECVMGLDGIRCVAPKFSQWVLAQLERG